MCDNCKENVNQELTELNKEQLQELQSLVSDTEPQEEMFSIPELQFEDFNQEEFNRGIKDASYVTGFFVACKNGGMYSADIMSLLINRETIEHNLKSGKMANEASIEIAKVQGINVDKSSI